MEESCHGSYAYTFPTFGAQGEENVVTKWKRTGNKLVKEAAMSVPLNSNLTI